MIVRQAVQPMSAHYHFILELLYTGLLQDGVLFRVTGCLRQPASWTAAFGPSTSSLLFHLFSSFIRLVGQRWPNLPGCETLGKRL